MAFVAPGDHASNMAVARLRANQHALCQAVANALRGECVASIELERAEKLLDISCCIGRANPFQPDAQKTLDCYAQLLAVSGE
jgi:hypothetical protein